MAIGHQVQAQQDFLPVAQIAGVTGIEVSAATGKLSVTADTPIDDAAVLAAVDEAGYAAVRSA